MKSQETPLAREELKPHRAAGQHLASEHNGFFSS
jgi:hypothetical protein